MTRRSSAPAEDGSTIDAGAGGGTVALDGPEGTGPGHEPVSGASEAGDGGRAPSDEPVDGPPPPAPEVVDLVLGAAVLLLLIANAPGQYRGSPLLLALVVLPLGAAGLVSAVAMAVRGDRPARWGIAFLAWAGLATLLSPQPDLSFNGGWGADRGWIYLAAYVGAWAIGRLRGPTATRIVTFALLAGLVCNALICFAQAAIPDGVGLITLYDGRVMGFPLNPVMVAALMAGGAAMCASLLGRQRDRWALWLAPIGLFGVILNMAGSRVALVSALLLAPLAAWVAGRSPRRVGAVVVVLVLGIVLGGQLIGASATERLAASSAPEGSGLRPRVIMWEVGASKLAERPLVGWGPNRFRSVVSPEITSEFAERGSEQLFADAHNGFVEIGVATGVVGLGLAIGFAVSAGRRARGPLAWYAAAIAVTWLLEPLAVATVPTALIALGLAAKVAPEHRPVWTGAGRWAAIGVSVLLSASVAVVAARQVYADRLIAELPATTDQLGLAERIADLLPNDPGISALHVQVAAEDATLFPERGGGPEALALAERGVSIDPMDYRAWNDLGVARQRFTEGSQRQRFARAREAWIEAIERHPYDPSTLTSLYLADGVLDDPESQAIWEERLCELGRCPDF